MKLKSRPKSQFPRSAKLRRLASIFGSDRGQSLIELALLTPILLMLVVGIVEMGRYAYLSILVGNAAEAGAQYGARSLANAADTVGITNAAKNDFSNGQNLTGLNVTFPNGTPAVCQCDNGGAITATTCTSTCNPGHLVVSVQVKASGTFNPLFSYATPLFGKLKINSITPNSTATERVAQ